MTGRPLAPSCKNLHAAEGLTQVGTTGTLAVRQVYASIEEPGMVARSPGYCPDPECPSNSAYSVGSRTFFRITLQKGIYCAHCGEVLEKVCPSCGAQINEGAVCTMCGTPYVK